MIDDLSNENLFTDPVNNLTAGYTSKTEEKKKWSREKIAWEGEFIFKRAIRELG